MDVLGSCGTHWSEPPLVSASYFTDPKRSRALSRGALSSVLWLWAVCPLDNFVCVLQLKFDGVTLWVTWRLVTRYQLLVEYPFYQRTKSSRLRCFGFLSPKGKLIYHIESSFVSDPRSGKVTCKQTWSGKAEWENWSLKGSLIGLMKTLKVKTANHKQWRSRFSISVRSQVLKMLVHLDCILYFRYHGLVSPFPVSLFTFILSAARFDSGRVAAGKQLCSVV